MTKDSPRLLAYNTILKCVKNKTYSNIELNNVIKKSSLEDSDKRLYTTLVYGTLEKMITLDFVISQLSKTPGDRLGEDVKCALRLGIYQILFLDRIPDFASCDESVKIIKRSGNPKAASFVNGILRNVIRNKEECSDTFDCRR